MAFDHQHLRHVLRRLKHSPMFTGVTILTIAIGVGATSAIFSVVNGILLKPLPYLEPEALVALWETAPNINLPKVELSPADYFIFAEQNRSFSSMGVWNGGAVTVTGKDRPEQVRNINVTEGILTALSVAPALGRAFTDKDTRPGSPETVILTHAYWQRKFGGDPSALGRTLLVDGKPRDIIGVMPAGFRFLTENPDVVLPMRFDRAKTNLGNYSFPGIGRLKPGVTLAQANADAARMLPIALSSFPPPPGFSTKLFEEARFQPAFRSLHEDVVGELSKVLWVLMGSIGVVLLIACANVANLLLVRAEGRQQELAIRQALGASRGRIAGDLLFESLVLGLMGGAAGLGLAWAALRLLVSIAPAYLPRLENLTIDGPVILFTVALSLMASALFGLVPVIKHSAPNVNAALRGGSRTLSQSRERHRTRNVLVVVQTGLAVVLLIASGLMVRTFQSLRRVDPGFQAAGLQTFEIFIPGTAIREPERVLRSFEETQRRLSEIPGVTMVAFGNTVPMGRSNSSDVLYAEDRTYREGEVPPIRRTRLVAPGYFQTMGTRLVAGRDFTWNELYDMHHIAIVTENLAREMWRDPNSALGKRIREGAKDHWREIVGVVADVRHDGVDQKAPATVYWPILREGFVGGGTDVTRSPVFLVRTDRAGSESLMNQVREAVWSLNRETPVARVRTMEEIYRASMARSSFALVMLAIAGGMALLLGIVGIYGVISYAVSKRTCELGIRIALGAPHRAVQAMVVRQGVVVALIGVVAGLVAAGALTRLMGALLFGISPVDPVTYSAVSIGLIGAAAAASYLPARRASNVNPTEALRAE
jgi:putative ABC transport system permease protein